MTRMISSLKSHSSDEDRISVVAILGLLGPLKLFLQESRQDSPRDADWLSNERYFMHCPFASKSQSDNSRTIFLAFFASELFL